VIDKAGLVNVYLNGVRLTDADYTIDAAANSVTLGSGATVGDIVEIEVFGNFAGQSGADVAITGGSITGLTELSTGTFTSTGIDDNATSTAITIDASENVGIGTSSPSEKLDFGGSGWLKVGKGVFNGGGAIFPYTESSSGSRSWAIQNDVNAYGDFCINQSTTQTGDVKSGASRATRFMINSSGNVGIGTASPEAEARLSVAGGRAYFDAPNEYTLRVLKSGVAGAFIGTSAANTLNFYNGIGTERMRLDSSGNLLVGKTDTTGNVAGISLRPSGLIVGTVSSGAVGYFNRTTSDGTIIDLRKDNVQVGSIGCNGGDLTIGTGVTTLKYVDSLDTIHPNGTGSGSDGNTTLGWSNNRFKDLYLSGGVYLGGTGAANKLDSYEEGTWTPALAGASGQVYGSQFGRYVKIGNKVTLWFDFSLTTAPTGGSNIYIPLPFSPSGSSTAQNNEGSIGFDNALVHNADRHTLKCYLGLPNLYVYDATSGTPRNSIASWKVGSLSGVVELYV
jgi:hypothetical protein